MQKLVVRGANLGEMTQKEQTEFIEWTMQARSRTTFDPAILGYHRTAMFIAEVEGQALAYLPVQTVLMAEVFIPQPESTNKERALALGRFDEALMLVGSSLNIGDVYCFCPLGEEKYMEKIMAHGWVEVPQIRLFKKATGAKVPEIQEVHIEAGQRE